MRRIRLVVAMAAMMVAMLSFSVPAMADVDLDDDWYEERAELIDEYNDELEDAHEDGVILYDIYDIDDLDVVYWALD
jgi:hypothetical protein